MPVENMEDTQPNMVPAAPRKRIPWFIPLLVVILLLLVGVLGGYASGMGVRYSTQKTLISGQLQQQLQMGVQAMDEGLYEVARENFENIIKTDPNFPGVKQAYADLLLRMQVTPTLVPSQTPSLTLTPDTRGAEAQFQSAQEQLNAGNWDGTIAILDSLRKNYPAYNTTQVDGMYYAALYQRGMSKLQPVSCSTVNLEGGLYDLSMAERFGPLDPSVDGWRIYTRLYITGASFWEQDWKQAQYYFGQVMAAFPNLMDASCMTATERWRQATVHYADELYAKGEICAARDQYESALNVSSPKNEEIYPTVTAVVDECGGGSSESSGNSLVVGTTPVVTLTPTPTP